MFLFSSFPLKPQLSSQDELSRRRIIFEQGPAGRSSVCFLNCSETRLSSAFLPSPSSFSIYKDGHSFSINIDTYVVLCSFCLATPQVPRPPAKSTHDTITKCTFVPLGWPTRCSSMRVILCSSVLSVVSYLLTAATPMRRAQVP